MLKFFDNEKKIISAMSDCSDGNMSLKEKFEKAVANREKFLQKFDLKLEDLIKANQPHDNKIKIVDSNDKGRDAKNLNWLVGFDGLITDEPNIILSVTTADCLPVLFFAPDKGVIAAVHMGWRCIEKNIAKQVAIILKNNYNCELTDAQVEIGPHIRQCCFEVQEPVAQMFANYKNQIKKTKNKYYIDLAKIVSTQLVKENFDEKNIKISRICTCCDKNYYSFRRDKDQLAGEMLSFIVKK